MGGAIAFRSNLGILDIGASASAGKTAGPRLAMESTEEKSSDRRVRRGDSLRDSYASRIKQIFVRIDLLLVY
jgi:hypothetical protein